MRKIILNGFLLFFVSILFGCSTGKEARMLALATLSQTLTYENEINNKIEAEKSYYQKSVNTIISSMERSETVSQLVILDRWAQSLQNKAYTSRYDLDPADLTKNVDILLQDLRKSRITYLSALKEYNDDLQKTLIQLNEKKSSLSKITRGLEKLQAEPADTEQIKLLFKFAKDVKTEFDNNVDKPPT